MTETTTATGELPAARAALHSTSHRDARHLVKLLREGRDYFTFARDESRDPEVARVFAGAELARRELLDTLVDSRLLDQASPALPTAALASDTGYAHLQAQFDPYHPHTQAEALYEREVHLLDLIRHVFRVEDCERLRVALKSHYSTFAACANSLQALVRMREAA